MTKQNNHFTSGHAGIGGLFFKLALIFIALGLLHTEDANANPGAIAEGFDVLLIIDDSASMGTLASTKKKTRSDPDGRRYDAINVLINQFYNASRIRDRVGQQELDIRFSIVSFGSYSGVVSDWFVVNSKEPPKVLSLNPVNKVWTDFNSAFAQAITQYRKIQFGKRVDQSNRELRIIILTDGEPSTKVNPGELYKDPKVWASMYEQLNTIDVQNKSLEVYLLAMNSPVNDYWKRVKDQWLAMESIPVKPVVIKTLGLTNSQLYSILAEEVVEKITPVGYLKPDTDGRFTVSCFQSTMSVEVYFMDKPSEVKLRAPDGRLIQPITQPRYINTSTYMQFDIDQPQSGEWQFVNYDEGFYQSGYTVIPFAVEYDYPGANGELLPTANKVKMRLSKGGARFTEEEINDCDVSGAMIYQYSAEASTSLPSASATTTQGTLAFKHGLDKISGDLILESEQPFKADVQAPTYLFNFNLLSKGESVFKDSRTFQLSSKTLLVTQVQNSATMVSASELVFKLDIKFKDYADKSLVDVANIFSDPGKALSISVQCGDVGCDSWHGSATTDKANGKKGPMIVPLSIVDSQTLGVRLALKKQGNTLSHLWNLATDGSEKQIKYQLKAPSNANINDDYVFIKGS